MVIRETLITAPSADMPSGFSLEEVKAHLNVVHEDDDELITSMMKEAISIFETSGGVKLRSQTWEVSYNKFPSTHNWLLISYRPFVSLVSLKYYDLSDVLQTLASTEYQVVAGFQARIYVGVEKVWPSVKPGRAENVIVQYTAGYSTVPDDILGALKLMVGDRYTSRGDNVKQKGINPAAERVIHMYSTSTPG